MGRLCMVYVVAGTTTISGVWSGSAGALIPIINIGRSTDTSKDSEIALGKARMALFGIAAGILSAYMHNNTGECIFSLPSNGICNKYIGIIMHEIGIFKHITFHSARHTFATTVALSNGMSIEVISSLLGHKSISTTQIYATVDRGIAAESMERLSENIDSLYSQIDTRREKSLIRVF